MSDLNEFVEEFQKRRRTYLRSLWLCAALVVAGIVSVLTIHNSVGFILGAVLMGLAAVLYYGLAAVFLRCPSCKVPQIIAHFAGFTLGGASKYSSQSSGLSVRLNPEACRYCSTRLR